MPYLNEVRLMGNLTRDPELRYTPKGTAVATLGLAMNRKWRDNESNEMREEVTFVDVTFFGKSAETLSQYSRKGHPIFLAGRLKLESWEDKQTGQKKSKLAMMGESFQFLKSQDSQERGDADESGEYRGAFANRPPAQQSAAERFRAAEAKDTAYVPPVEDDDVPF